MKKLHRTFTLLLLPFLLSFSATAQISIDPTAFKRLMELKNLVDKAKKQIVQLKEVNKSSAATKFNTSGLLGVISQAENAMRNISEFGMIQTSDGKKFSDIFPYLNLNKTQASNPSYYYNTKEMRDLNVHLSKDLTQDAGNNLYDFFYKRTSPEAGIATYGQLVEEKNTERQKLFSFQTAMQKKKFMEAMVYYKMADKLYTDAIALSNAISSPHAGTPVSINPNGLFNFGNIGMGDGLSDPFNIDISGLFDIGGGGGLFSGIFGGNADEIREKLLAQQMKDILGKIDAANPGYSSSSELATPEGVNGLHSGLRMSTGERIQAQKSAIEMMNKSAEYKEKGDKLMAEALEKSPLQKEVELSQHNALVRKAMTKIQLQIPQ